MIEATVDDDGGTNLLQIIGLGIFALAGSVLLIGIGATVLLRSRYR